MCKCATCVLAMFMENLELNLNLAMYLYLYYNFVYIKYFQYFGPRNTPMEYVGFLLDTVHIHGNISGNILELKIRENTLY